MKISVIFATACPLGHESNSPTAAKLQARHAPEAVRSQSTSALSVPSAMRVPCEHLDPVVECGQQRPHDPRGETEQGAG